MLESRVQKGQKVSQSRPPDAYEFSPIPDSCDATVTRPDENPPVEVARECVHWSYNGI